MRFPRRVSGCGQFSSLITHSSFIPKIMKMIRSIFVLAAAAGLIFSYTGCERHTWEETKVLQEGHGKGDAHGEHRDHGDGYGDKHGDDGHGGDKDHKKGDHDDHHDEDEKAEKKGRKVF